VRVLSALYVPAAHAKARSIYAREKRFERRLLGDDFGAWLDSIMQPEPTLIVFGCLRDSER